MNVFTAIDRYSRCLQLESLYMIDISHIFNKFIFVEISIQIFKQKLEIFWENSTSKFY